MTGSQSPVNRKKTQAAASAPSDASDEGEARKRSKKEAAAAPVKESKDTKAPGKKSSEVKKPATSQSSEVSFFLHFSGLELDLPDQGLVCQMH